MIYAAFAVWLLLILFLGIGTYRLWMGLARPGWVDWALLPGTAVSEIAYIIGCLVTGGEIRRVKLIDSRGAEGGKKGKAGGPGADASPGLKFVGPIIAALLGVIACGAAILLVHALLGEPVMAKFPSAADDLLQKRLPDGWDGFWAQLGAQVRLLQRTCEAFAGLDWLDWRVPVFVYLALCLSIQLAPARRAIRPALLAVVVIAAVIALIGALSARFGDLMDRIWPLLTYVYASLLLGLVVTLILRGVIALVKALRSKGG